MPPRSDGQTPPAKGVSLNLARDSQTQRWIGAGGLLVNYGPLRNVQHVRDTRFPLEHGQWSKKRILDELGPGGSEQRDSVLARELVKRDLTEDELLAVLLGRQHAENGAVLQAVVDTHPFFILRKVDEVNFTDVALDILRQEVHAESAYNYAATHGATAADYRALKALPRLENTFMALRDAALLRMRKRLGLDEDGNPIAAK